MRAILVEPEDCSGTGESSAGHRQLHPIANRQIFRLAHAPDVACFYRMLQQCLPILVDDANRSVCWNQKRLVVRAILLGLLRHQADVGYGAHGGNVERAVLLAVVDDFLVDAGVTAIGNHVLRVARLTVRSPHLSGGSNGGRHRCVNDDVAGHVQVGDAFVGIDHRQSGLRFVDRLDISLDLFALRRRQFLNL